PKPTLSEILGYDDGTSDIKPDSELCRHVGTLRLMRENLQSKLLLGERVDPDDIRKLDAALKAYMPKREAPEISVHIVKTLRGKCPKCGTISEISRTPFPNEPNQTHPDPAVEAAARAAATPPEPPPPPEPFSVKGWRPEVSLSEFHAAVLSNNEVPPLKKRQPGIHTKRDACR